MVFVQNVLLFLHFIGLASLLGGFLVQLRTVPRVINNAMLHGALLQLPPDGTVVSGHWTNGCLRQGDQRVTFLATRKDCGFE